jgi:hypothetical protein
MQQKMKKNWHLTTIKLLLLIIPILFELHYTVAAGPIVTGGVGVVANPGGVSTGTKCGNNVTSCGQPGKCVDLTGVAYCINGHTVETICSSNIPKNVTRTSSCQNFQSQLNVTNKVGSQRSVNIRFYTPDTTQVLKSFSINGDGSISSLSSPVDFELDYDDAYLKFKAKNLDLSKLDPNTRLIIDRLLITIPNIDVYKAYLVELPSNFTYSSITLSIKYSDTTVRNENQLKFYRCDDFNFGTSTCNGSWNTVDTITLDSANKVTSANINHFSVYALGEPKQNTTITTTTTTTISQNDDDEEDTDSYSSSYHSSSSYAPSTTATTLPECIRNKPNLSVNPLSQAGVVGDTLQYNVTVKNMDSVECDGREFEFQFELPQGWMVGHDPIERVEPEETKLVNVMIQSSNEAVTNETYQLSVYVLDKDSKEESNTVYFKYIVNALPDTGIKDKVEQTQLSPLTAFASLITGNQLILMLPAVVSIIVYIIWRRPVLMIKGLTRSYGQKSYNEVIKPKIVVRTEPDTQPKINTTFNNGNTFNGGIKQIDNKTKTAMIEEIRRKALKYDETFRKKF